MLLYMSKTYSMVNFYELEDVKKFSPTYHNPRFNEDTLPLKHPFRAIIVGSSGSGKTVLVSNIINCLSGTFNTIIIYTANKAEPIYQYLESSIPKEQLQVHESLAHLNKTDLNSGLGQGQTLVIFDDLVIESGQQQIENLFIRGRKMNDNKGISVIYLTQAYYLVPGVIRKNINFLFIKKLSGIRDRRAILKEGGALLDKEQRNILYDYCTESFLDFLLICLDASDDKKFRRGFNEIVQFE